MDNIVPVSLRPLTKHMLFRQHKIDDSFDLLEWWVRACGNFGRVLSSVTQCRTCDITTKSSSWTRRVVMDEAVVAVAGLCW